MRGERLTIRLPKTTCRNPRNEPSGTLRSAYCSGCQNSRWNTYRTDESGANPYEAKYTRGHKRSRHQEEEKKHAFARSRSRRRTAREKRCYISPWVIAPCTHLYAHARTDSRIDHTLHRNFRQREEMHPKVNSQCNVKFSRAEGTIMCNDGCVP